MRALFSTAPDPGGLGEAWVGRAPVRGRAPPREAPRPAGGGSGPVRREELPHCLDRASASLPPCRGTRVAFAFGLTVVSLCGAGGDVRAFGGGAGSSGAAPRR